MVALHPCTDKQRVVLEKLLVHACLQGRELALHHLLHFVRQILLNVLLEPPQEKWPEHLVQPPDDQQALLLRELQPLLVARVLERGVEPLVKRLHRVEHLRQDEVQQRPELRKAVLERRARQDEPVPRPVVLRERLEELRLRVFQPVTLIDDHVRPPELRQHVPVPDHVLVRCQQHREVPRPDSVR